SFFNDTASTEIYTLSYTTLFRSKYWPNPILLLLLLQLCLIYMIDQLISLDQEAFLAVNQGMSNVFFDWLMPILRNPYTWAPLYLDRKSTRLNSSHVKISYAVFCL